MCGLRCVLKPLCTLRRPARHPYLLTGRKACRRWLLSLPWQCLRCLSPTYAIHILHAIYSTTLIHICSSDLIWLRLARPSVAYRARPSGHQVLFPRMLHVRRTIPMVVLRVRILDLNSRHTASSDQGARTLGGATFTNTTGMTVEACVTFCSGQDFNFAGLEFAQECCACASHLVASRFPPRLLTPAHGAFDRVRQLLRERRH